MGKHVIDISQIRKYLNGELDAQAMHKLERQALDDPFLADALEGYQQSSTDQQANLDELSARLNQRTAKKEARVIPLWFISAAASVLIICSVGIWWFTHKDNPSKVTPTKQIAARVSPGIPASDTVSTNQARAKTQQAARVEANRSAPAPAREKRPATASQPVLADNAVTAGNDVAIKREDVLKKTPVATQAQTNSQTGFVAPADTTPLNEAIVMNYKSNNHPPVDTSLFVRKSQLKEVRIIKRDSATQQRLVAQAPGVKVYPGNSSQTELDKAIEQGRLGIVGSNQLRYNATIAGKVISLDNGMPVKGASVKVLGTNQVTKTDAKGYFKLEADTTKNRLIVTNQGYRTRQVSANTKDSLKMIVLTPSDSDGAEDDLDSASKDEAAPYVSARPEKGWQSYLSYLKQKAVSPDGRTGMVKISFTVDKYGTIGNIKVVKGLSDAANKKAISLVKDGPAWAGSTDRKAKTVTLRINFGK